MHTFIYGRGRGMVVNEPSLVAIDKVSDEVIAVGNEALEMLGRSPEDVVVAYPMQDGVVADSELTRTMLKKFIRKARGGRARFSRRIIQSVPAGITSVERFAIRDVVNWNRGNPRLSCRGRAGRRDRRQVAGSRNESVDGCGHRRS